MFALRFGILRAGVVPVPLVLALLLPVAASAQTTTGVVSGTVLDPQGQAVPGATVTVINEATNDTRTAITDGERGSFQVTSLTPGSYTVRVALQGFRTFERKGVVVSSSERVSVGSMTPGRRRIAGHRQRARPPARTSTPTRRSTAASSPGRRSSRSRCSAVTSPR